MTEPTLAKKAERRAREMAREIYGTEGAWELFFSFAYTLRAYTNWTSTNPKARSEKMSRREIVWRNPKAVVTDIQQVGPDDFERVVRIMDLTPETTVREITAWYFKMYPGTRKHASVLLAYEEDPHDE